MSSQCLAHALPRYAARMNDPPVAVAGTGTRNWSGSTSSAARRPGQEKEGRVVTDGFWPCQKGMIVCVGA